MNLNDFCSSINLALSADHYWDLMRARTVTGAKKTT